MTGVPVPSKTEESLNSIVNKKPNSVTDIPDCSAELRTPNPKSSCCEALFLFSIDSFLGLHLAGAGSTALP
jgi:hypothetical protein